MKKITALILAVLMIFALASCSKKDTESTSTPDESKQASTDNGEASKASEVSTEVGTESTDIGTVPSIDFGSIMSGNSATDTVWGKTDEATKQQIIAAGKAEGVDVSFGADGSMTVVDPESDTTMLQSPDGTWSVVDEGGDVIQVGGNWPDNEFTKLLPKPTLEIVTTANNGDEFSVVFQNGTMDDMKEYAAQAATAGFNVNANTEDYSAQGMDIFSYSAVNADGYSISVSYSMGVSAVIVTKP